MKPYIVTVIDRNRKRHRYIAIANRWIDAWIEAANTHGIVALLNVKPAR